MVNVTDPNASAAGINLRGRFASLNKLRAIGYTENATTKRLTPPYVKMAQANTTAATAWLRPNFEMIKRATASAAPVSSINLPNNEPSKNMKNQDAINPENPCI